MFWGSTSAGLAAGALDGGRASGRSAMTDADGGAPSSASRDAVSDAPPAADEAIASPLRRAGADPVVPSVAGTVIGGSAAPWNETWSVSAGL